MIHTESSRILDENVKNELKIIEFRWKIFPQPGIMKMWLTRRLKAETPYFSIRQVWSTFSQQVLIANMKH